MIFLIRYMTASIFSFKKQRILPQWFFVLYIYFTLLSKWEHIVESK